MIEKIPYLKDLGVTAVELLPVFQFDPQDAPPGRVNYWGYQPISFFAPHHAYSSRKEPLSVLDEFRDMVKALHRAGIEVILDVVFNHTTEGGKDGPTLSYRGLANDFYYILEKDKSRYADYTGCGNTLNANQPIVRRLIQDSLRYWVTHMHVDGFRFDLASILSRDESGIRCQPAGALGYRIRSAVGRHQADCGSMGCRWTLSSGKLRWRHLARVERPIPRRCAAFFAGRQWLRVGVATRLMGSPDIYGHEEREAEQSINFVTCHDGFTLNDLVSYNHKHNEANGENNRDGSDDNLSWNCGAEGPTDDAAIEALRNRQVKNFLALELLAAGTPMLLMGDEVRRTQRGNNNAYCQDGDISWFDWSLLERHADIHRFVKALNAFRQRRDMVAEGGKLSLNQLLQRAKIEWHGVALNRPDWSEHSHSLAFTFRSLRARFLLHGMLNAYWEPLTFELPPVPAESQQRWRRCIDTALASPDDIYPWEKAPFVRRDDLCGAAALYGPALVGASSRRL